MNPVRVSPPSRLGALFIAGNAALGAQQDPGKGDPADHEDRADGEGEVVAPGQRGGAALPLGEQVLGTCGCQGGENGQA